MTEVQVTIGAFPTVAPITEGTTSRWVDLAFEIHNGSEHELDLVAIEQDVRTEDESLLERRTVDVNVRMAPCDRHTVLIPISRFGHRIPLVSLVYTFAFRAPWGGRFYIPVRVAPIGSDAPAQLEPTAQPIRERPVPTKVHPCRRGASLRKSGSRPSTEQMRAVVSQQ